MIEKKVSPYLQKSHSYPKDILENSKGNEYPIKLIWEEAVHKMSGRLFDEASYCFNKTEYT